MEGLKSAIMNLVAETNQLISTGWNQSQVRTQLDKIDENMQQLQQILLDHVASIDDQAQIESEKSYYEEIRSCVLALRVSADKYLNRNEYPGSVPRSSNSKSSMLSHSLKQA